MYSVMYKCVRISATETFAEAQEALLASLRERSRMTGDLRFSNEMTRRIAEVTRASDTRYLLRNAQWFSEWDGIVWKAGDGVYGLGVGDLCYARDYSNGHRMAWTIDVKAKIIGVYNYTWSPSVAIRITGESLQFRRYQTITVPASYIYRRNSPKRTF